MKLELEADILRTTGFRLRASLSCETEALGLVGPSGSGKSTLLDAVAGIEPGARVSVDGRDWSRLRLEERGVGYLSQDALLFPHLSVRENLLYSPRAGGLGDVPAALGIGPLLDRRPRHLSGGERRRVALARAILARPRVLLLDEPFGGLDEARRREAMSLLDGVLRRYRLPMILVSHLADEIIALTDWTVRLEEGRIVESGPSASILRSKETRIDNYLEGEVSGPGRVRVGDLDLQVVMPGEARGRVRLACYAHDILLSRGAPVGIPARNVLPVRVASITPAGDAVLVALENSGLRAALAAEAVAELGLQPGDGIFAVVKATSFVYLGPA